MSEIKNQHQRNLSNFAASLFFGLLLMAQLCVLWGLEEPPSLTLAEFTLLALAIFRLTRLFVYDGVMSFVRDLFLDIKVSRGKLVRSKKPFGAARVASDIFSCPWCFSIWGGSAFVWAYIMAPSVMMYVALILALSAVATFLQLLTNLLGWKAEYQKLEVQKHK